MSFMFNTLYESNFILCLCLPEIGYEQRNKQVRLGQSKSVM